MDRPWPTDPQYRQHLAEMARTAGGCLDAWLDHVERAAPEAYALLQRAEQDFVAFKSHETERLGIPFAEYEAPIIRYVPLNAPDRRTLPA